jgi:short chain dehydrogenase
VAGHHQSQLSVLVVGVGASRGSGAAIARRFWRAGHPVVIAGRNTEKFEKTAKEMKDAGAKAAFVTGEASNADDAKRFVAEAETLAPLAVAIHNAGGNEPAPFLHVSEERFSATGSSLKVILRNEGRRQRGRWLNRPRCLRRSGFPRSRLRGSGHRRRSSSRTLRSSSSRWLAFRRDQPDAFAGFMAFGRDRVKFFEKPFVSRRDDIVLCLGPRLAGPQDMLRIHN